VAILALVVKETALSTDTATIKVSGQLVEVLAGVREQKANFNVALSAILNREPCFLGVL